MELKEFLEYMDAGREVTANSEAHLCMHALSQEALRLTAELNGSYRTHEEIIDIMSRLTGHEVDDSFAVFPPFYTDCGKNIAIGKNVFFNSGCRFQDQGGITIGDGSLIGHNVVIATLNHNMNPALRGNLIPARVVIGKNVWVGANATICPGVTISDGAVIAAGAVVTQDVPENTVVGGVPARVLKTIEV